MSKLPKPSGLKHFQSRVTKPLETISENYLNRAREAPPGVISRIVPTSTSRLKRRSKSVTDLRSLSDNPPISRPISSSVTKAGGTKRQLPASKNNTDGQPKAKVAKKIPDWDYKGRFIQLTEKYASSQESLKEMKLKISEFGDIAVNYDRVKEEAKQLAETKYSLKEECESLRLKNQTLTENNEKLESDLALLDAQHNDIQADFKILEASNKKLSENIETTTKENDELSSSLSTLTEKYEKLLQEHMELTKKNCELTEKFKSFTEQHKDVLTILNEKTKVNKEYEEIIAVQKSDLQNFQEERRRLHNCIQDLKGNIRVFCRVRPPINSEEHERLQCCINFIDENGIDIRKSRESVSQITGKVQEFKSEFFFDKVFSPASVQEEIFEDLSQLVQSALDGYDICVFAYGQTGSGKTFTMQGGESPESKGMIPRTIDLIFENIAKLERSGWKYTVQASFLEIYNENVRDLLNINSSQKLDICFNEGKGITVMNLTIQSIKSAYELTEYMKLAHRNRATAATNFNEHSSRSHAVTKIYLEGMMKDQNTLYRGSINLVDLAGSESAKQSLSGERLVETKNINKSLATLGDVISALHCKSKHIPYRIGAYLMDPGGIGGCKKFCSEILFMSVFNTMESSASV